MRSGKRSFGGSRTNTKRAPVSHPVRRWRLGSGHDPKARGRSGWQRERSRSRARFSGLFLTICWTRSRVRSREDPPGYVHVSLDHARRTPALRTGPAALQRPRERSLPERSLGLGDERQVHSRSIRPKRASPKRRVSDVFVCSPVERGRNTRQAGARPVAGRPASLTRTFRAVPASPSPERSRSARSAYQATSEVGRYNRLEEPRAPAIRGENEMAGSPKVGGSSRKRRKTKITRPNLREAMLI